MNRTGKTTLIPSVMGSTVDDVTRDAAHVVNLSPILNYDVADGQFVPATTPRPEDYPKVPEGIQIFWHLMVHEPIAYLDACLEHPSRMIALHAEAREVPVALSRLVGTEILAGITLNPRTLPRDVADLIEQVAFVQIMTIEPGAQGRLFQPELLAKLDLVRTINPQALLVVDGGANSGTIEAIVRYRPDYIAVGSALTRAESPVDAWAILNRIVATTLAKG